MTYDDQYPECSKLAAVTEERSAITEFLEWCETKGYHLGLFIEGRMAPVPRSTDSMVMEHLEIDTKKLEVERRAMLADFDRETRQGPR